MIFVQTFRQIMGNLTERKTPTFQKDVEYVPETSVWAMLCCLLVITKNYVLRTSWCLSTWNYTGLLFKCRVTFRLRQTSKATFGTLALYTAFEISCDTQYLKQQLFIFSETWAPSFCIVCNCFDDFRTNLPKNNGRSHRKENTNIPKRRWVRSKNVCLSYALLSFGYN